MKFIYAPQKRLHKVFFVLLDTFGPNRWGKVSLFIYWGLRDTKACASAIRSPSIDGQEYARTYTGRHIRGEYLMRKILALSLAILMVLGIIAGLAAPAYAEENHPYYAEENKIVFWSNLEFEFDQSIDPAQPFQCGYAVLKMDGNFMGYVQYVSLDGKITLYAEWFFRHENLAYKAEVNYCHSFTVYETSDTYVALALCRVNKETLTGGVSIGFTVVETEGGSVVEWTDVHEIATVKAIPVTADGDVIEPWENYVVASGRSDMLTAGTSKNTFSPTETITRAQAVTMLWRAFDSPNPAAEMPFEDVPVNAYYYTAVRWAAENGITAGTTAVKFSPDKTCTRGEIALFAYRCKQLREGEKPYSNTSWIVYDLGETETEFAWERDRFQDVPADCYYKAAVGWSINEVPIFTSGLTPESFGPNEPCSRALCLLYAEEVAGG